MASIQIILPITKDAQGVSAPPSSSELFPQWGWTPERGVVSIKEIGLVDPEGTQGVYEVTGPDSLIVAIEASA